MKTLIPLLFSTFIFIHGSFSQEINFCLNYTVLGEPIRVSNSWNIGADGGYLYVLFKQPEVITRNIYHLVIEEEKDGVFNEVKKQQIIPETGKNWVAHYCKFRKGGDFKVLILKNNEVITSDYLTILTQRQGITGRRKFRKDPRLLYANTKVIACETVKGGKAINPSAVFNVSEDVSEVTFLILNEKSVNPEKLNIDIYKKAAPFDNYSVFVESKRLSVTRSSQETYFTLQFAEPGDYKVYIYDQDQVWINSGYVTIHSPSSE